MKKTSFGVFAVFGVFLLLAIVASGQIASSEGPSVSSVFSGSVEVGKAGYFEVADKARIDINHYVGVSGQDLLLDVTNKLPQVGKDTTFTFAVQIDDLRVVSFASGTPAMVSKEVFNWTTVEFWYPANGTGGTETKKVNLSTVLVPGMEWSELPYHVFEWDGRRWIGVELNLKGQQSSRFKVVLKSGKLGERVKYSYLMNASDVYVEFDPVLDDGLVAYWDGSGTGNTSTDIFGNYDGAIGLNVERQTQTPIKGGYFRRLVATSAQPVLTITDNAFDAIGAAGGEDWTFSFWMNTTDLTGGNPPHFIVGKSCTGTGCTQASPFTILTGNATTANGNMQWKGYPGSRNNVDNTLLATTGWHNVVLTANSTGAFYYLDGIPRGNRPLNAGGGLASQAANVTFGCNADGADNTTTCSGNFDIANIYLDEISFWGRSFDQSDVLNLYYNGTNGTFCTGDPCSFSVGGSSNANETEGDNAIEVAINSSVPSATKYKTRQVYVVNATNSQQKGTVDFLVVQNSPQRRWLLNYITTGEAYLNAQNLSGTVYVLEIANKTTAQITDEVSKMINATK